MGKRKKSKNKAKLICPKCHVYWANIQFEYGGGIYPEDVEVLVNKQKGCMNKEGTLTCSSCGYTFTNWDMLLCISGVEWPDNWGKIEKSKEQI